MIKKSLVVGLVAGVGIALAGCGSDDEAGSGSTAAAERQLRVAYASALDPNDVADQIGLEIAGAKVTTLTDDSAVVAGLLRDSLDVGNVDFDAAITARSEGVPLKIIYVSQMQPEYVLVGKPGITSIKGLAGQRVGFHAPGSQTEIFVKNIVEQQAPEVVEDVDFVALEESSRRAQALVAGRLDASALEAINLAALLEEGDYTELATWGDLTGDASNVRGTAWITTEEIYETEKEALTLLVQSLQEGYDTTYDDKQAWLDASAKAVPDVDQEVLPAVYQTYVDQDMYPKSGEAPITPESFAVAETFFRELGGWEEEQSDDIVAYDLIAAGSGTEVATGTETGGQ